MSQSLYEIEVRTLEGEAKTLEEHKGSVLLIVNTASKCGYTPQLGGLQELHEKYKDRGLAVLGFPCNQFLKQEPGDEAEIGAFCQRNYGVSFPMHAKIEVNGAGAHPLYQHLKKERPGLLGTEAIKWNFTKFLVDPKGKVLKRYGPRTLPREIAKDIEALLPG